MVCTANDLQGWKDFPKGLRVLLLDGDSSSAAEIRTKLEAMDYIVSIFCNENEALSAISNKPESFHVAIVEVGTSNSDGSFKFLEMAKDLPTIMTSNIDCLSTTMKCIALGAVEFLRKPLSEDKLKNIWQHVVHKAFNAGGDVLSESLKPVKESVVSMLQLQLENGESDNKRSIETENVTPVNENDHELSAGSDKYPAPSTPQLKQGVRLLDDVDCQDQTNCSTEKESGEQDGESKSVETTCGNSIAESTLQECKPQLSGKFPTKEEEESTDGCKSEIKVSPHPNIRDKEEVESADGCKSEIKVSPHPNIRDKDEVESADGCKNEIKVSPHPNIRDKEEVESADGCKSEIKVFPHPNIRDDLSVIGGGSAENPSKASGLNNSCGGRANRKKMKVDWTPELHKKFVQAVEQLGVDQAIPSRILELMKVDGLTRHNVASHLQKYRMHKRHILPKEEERRWPFPKEPMQRSYYPQRPIMAFPPYHSNHTLSVAPAYPMWGQPGGHLARVQMWGAPGYTPWQPTDNWLWKPSPGMHADAWGCPVVPPPHSPYPSSYPQNTSGFYHAGAVDINCGMPHNSFDLHPAEEVIDKIVKEAISKPGLPLPLGLKPPSTDIVLAELSRQGISTIPPRINGCNPR